MGDDFFVWTEETPSRKTGYQAKDVQFWRLKLPFSYNIVSGGQKNLLFSKQFQGIILEILVIVVSQ